MNECTEFLRIALSKGRILEETVELLEGSGIKCQQVKGNGRKLIYTDEKQGVSFILGKPMDIPTYVEYGAADLGVVGKDVLMETEGEYYELLDLNIGYCKLVVAGEKDKTERDYRTIASKYPKLTEKYFESMGRQTNIVKLNGSVELAPLTNLADSIVDLVSSGQTLRENNLVELEKITDITTRLIANKGSYQLKQARIVSLVENMQGSI
ncbi:ATP phosphoribosyltransferase [Natranaerobius trueperi]|uniref:ATP phosphoribosyltransferase n=1 Tax=Natranaerobius trueperi TaxID=759412 RepID=A0A226C081_9FIRM|nr:ATP phosphoribosyltransferase [Natranaerobius trueperi]OWZ83777.1 ATP phosphoribosyltransferase [Natranaerobius trueperi]